MNQSRMFQTIEPFKAANLLDIKNIGYVGPLIIWGAIWAASVAYLASDLLP